MASTNLAVYTCDQENCPVRTIGISGQCLESFPIVANCPHVKVTKEADPASLTIENSREVTEDLDEATFTGDEIYEDKIQKITYQYPTKLILLMGDSEAGKTTLLASLYDKFQKGPCGIYHFAGSRTQIGFEKRCFLARWTGSGRPIPDTERTKSLVMHYLHLAVRNPQGDTPTTHLIFTDVSGEQFRIVRDSETEMQKFSVIKRADHIFFLVNGEQLTDLDARQKVKSSSIKLIQRAIENSMVNQDTSIVVIITKLDKIKEQLESIRTFFVSDLKSRFPNHIKGFMYVASRSLTGDVAAGTGLDEIFVRILQLPEPSSPHTELPKPTREFHKFTREK